MRAMFTESMVTEVVEVHACQYEGMGKEDLVTIEVAKHLSYYEEFNIKNSKYDTEVLADVEYHVFGYDMQRYSYAEAWKDALARIENAARTGFIDLRDLQEVSAVTENIE